jgi:hypothetical protein
MWFLQAQAPVMKIWPVTNDIQGDLHVSWQSRRKVACSSLQPFRLQAMRHIAVSEVQRPAWHLWMPRQPMMRRITMPLRKGHRSHHWHLEAAYINLPIWKAAVLRK